MNIKNQNLSDMFELENILSHLNRFLCHLNSMLSEYVFEGNKSFGFKKTNEIRNVKSIAVRGMRMIYKVRKMN